MAESPFPSPDLFQARRILCIQPHYDDADIAAGGSLAALHDAGAELFYLTVTNDLVGVLDTTLTEAEAQARLRSEQVEAGKHIGVSQQYWLDYPDAGKYDYYDLRRELIKHIRLLRPDFIFTNDPWLPNEAHRDHLQTGMAAAEAAVLYAMLRLPSDPQVDAAYQPHELIGVAFYFTREPNTFVDISQTCERKAQAVRCYKAQFTPESTERLVQVLDYKERQYAEGRGYSHAEAFKVLHPGQLHCGI